MPAYRCPTARAFRRQMPRRHQRHRQRGCGPRRHGQKPDAQALCDGCQRSRVPGRASMLQRQSRFRAPGKQYAVSWPADEGYPDRKRSSPPTMHPLGTFRRTPGQQQDSGVKRDRAGWKRQTPVRTQPDFCCGRLLEKAFLRPASRPCLSPDQGFAADLGCRSASSRSLTISNTRTTLRTPLTLRAISAARAASRSVTRPIR